MKFLVAEDEPGSRLVLVHFLKSFARIDEAEDGQIAVQLFQAALASDEKYDLVFLDIMMPRKSGQEALSEIRALEIEQGILGSNGVPVMMATALDDEENIFDAHVSGISSYVVKPIGRDALIQELARLGFSPAPTGS